MNSKEGFLKQRSLLDFDDDQEQEVRVIDEKIENLFDSSRITAKINKSGKIIEAIIKDNESEEAISRNEYKLFNAILSICQNHSLSNGVPKHIYVGASTLAKMMNISRQQANSKVEFKGKTITFLEEKLYSLQKKQFISKRQFFQQWMKQVDISQIKMEISFTAKSKIYSFPLSPTFQQLEGDQQKQRFLRLRFLQFSSPIWI